MRVKIELDTRTDVINFVHLTNQVKVPVTVTDNNGLRVNAKSVMGMLYSLEFAELWCECEEDIFSLIHNYVVE